MKNKLAKKTDLLFCNHVFVAHLSAAASCTSTQHCHMEQYVKLANHLPL